MVKTAVVEYLTPFIAECNSKEKAQAMLLNNLNGINEVVDGVLKEQGFNYTAKSLIKNEEFPTRVYGTLQLESGFYDALIIELGEGKGDNWWCVIYPPLCYVKASGEGSVRYKSLIKELWEKYFGKN
jgi:stage II sporulation protein R